MPGSPNRASAGVRRIDDSSRRRLSRAKGLRLLSTCAAAACCLSGTEAFAPAPPRSLAGARSSPATKTGTAYGGGGGVIETGTALRNRSDRRKEKKKKNRSALVVEDDEAEDEDDSAAAATAKSGTVILSGGGEIGANGEIPAESNIPIATGGPKAKKRSNLDRELAGERIETEDEDVVGESVVSAASVSDIPTLPGMEQPDVSRVITDPDTGIARIQQGKNVLDKVTGRAVKLSGLGPEYRLAQMFPGASPELRAQYRFDWNSVTVPEMVDLLREACNVPLKNSKTGKEWTGIPPHPQISNPAADFVLANRDHLGHRMKKALGRLKLRAQSQFKKEEAYELRRLWKHFLLLEDHVSAPFRQIMIDAETKVGANFGNLDVKSYCGGEVYERAASYLVLKSMVAHWEKKYADAQYLDSTAGSDTDDEMTFLDEIYTGDPKRYLKNPPIIFRLTEVSRIVAMAQKMTQELVDDSELFDDLPPEVRFIEQALAIQGGTALRKFLLEDFCPKNDVDPASLREGLRRLYQQMFNMQIDPYGDLTMTLWNLCVATGVGTDDEREPYRDYIANIAGTDYDTNPGFFQTYTFDHDKNSLVRFLDSSKKIERGTAGPVEEVQRQVLGEVKQLFGNPFGLGKPKKEDSDKKVEKEEPKAYVPPEDRAIGRPHMMGWLDLLGKDEELTGGVGDEGGLEKEEETFDADNWVAVE